LRARTGTRFHVVHSGYGLTDYEELAARSFEEHHDPELRAAVQVCADALGQIDDPRGPLISYEYALYDAEPKRRSAAQGADAHVSGTPSALPAARPLLVTARDRVQWRWGCCTAYVGAPWRRRRKCRPAISCGSC
jgi:hypothetical protein